MLTVLASSLSGVAASLSASITGSSLERGKPGQTITVSATGLTLTAVSADYALSNGGVVTAAALSDNIATLTVTGPPTTGSTVVSFDGVASNAIEVSDTVAPPEPTLQLATVSTNYSVRVTWISESDSYGGTVSSYNILQNGSVIAVVEPPADTFVIAAVSAGDVLGVEAVDPSGNVSALNTATFNAPAIPAAGDVRAGVAVGSGYGTLAVPAASAVLAGVPVDAQVGTVTLPDPSAVEAGVQFGAGGSQYTGSYAASGGVTTIATSNGVVRQPSRTVATAAGIVRSQS